MNPEEGRLRPQILDRFGLRVIVRGLNDLTERLEAYRRVQAYLANSRAMAGSYNEETLIAAGEVQNARARLSKVILPDNVAKPAIKLIQKMGINSLRAEISWFEAGRAYAAADARNKVTMEDLQTIAPMALRLRRSQFMVDFFSNQDGEEKEMQVLLEKWGKKVSPQKKRS
jgi:magnesium chelatase subunit I